MGGLERILIEVLKNMDRSKYKIHLFIEDDCGKENVFEKDIPKDVEYKFLKPEKIIRFTEKVKQKKKNIIYKLIYNIMMVYEKKIAFKNLKKGILEINGAEAIIDFDAGLSKNINKIKDLKKIVWIHNSVPKLKKKRGKIERFGKRLGNYDKVVAICDDMKEELIKIYPFLKEKVVRIYNPFNFDRILSLAESKKELTKEELQFLEDDYMISVARLDNIQKDFPTLMKAYKSLKDKGIKEKLYIVGHGPSKEDISSLINELNLEEDVKLLGMKKNPYVWMKNSKLFVHSSKYEGLPTVLIEAMICGKIVVSSDCPTGPREILLDGECGGLVKVGDVEDFSNQIYEILSNSDKRKNLELLIEKRVKDFEASKIVVEIDTLIENLTR